MSQEKELPEVMTPEDVAEYLQISTDEVHRLIKAGEIPFAKTGRQWRAMRIWIEEYKKNMNKE